jgi:hypothetical protein
MTVPPFALSEQDLGSDGSKQLRQLLWAKAAAAAAAELPPPPVSQQLLHPEDPAAEWVVLQEWNTTENSRSFDPGTGLGNCEQAVHSAGMRIVLVCCGICVARDAARIVKLALVLTTGGTFPT